MLVTRSIVFAIIFYATTALMLLGLVWLLLAPRSWAIAALRLHGRISIWLLARICHLKMEVRGAERIKRGACLVAAKHQSTWDTFALLTLFADPAIVMKDELKLIPVYGWFCLKFEHILVKRERAAVALRRVRSSSSRKAPGKCLALLPTTSLATSLSMKRWMCHACRLHLILGCIGRGAQFCATQAPSSSRYLSPFNRVCVAPNFARSWKAIWKSHATG
jgi:hypothetical protein